MSTRPNAPTDLSHLPSLADTIREHGLAVRKSLGQHFLLNMELLRKIVRIANVPAGATLIEIGPGPGGLTRALVESDAAQILAIEKDTRCLAALQPVVEAASGRLRIIEADALRIDLLAETTAPRAIVANLPYNVGTELLLQWLGDIAQHGAQTYGSITVLLQKEVAQRITASPRSKDYGRLSIFCQWLCDCRALLDVPPGAFSPPPKVDSQVVQLVPRMQKRVECERKDLEQVVRIAFQGRRKMLRASLKPLRADAEEWLVACGIDPTLRADQLTVEQYGALAKKLRD